MLLTQDQILLFKQAIKNKTIKVIGFDLETSPSLFWGWRAGEQWVDASNLKENTETRIITAQYKEYLIDKKSKYLMWDYNKETGGDDASLVEETIRILNDADIIIGQNSKSFDQKVLQERAKALGLPPINIDFMIDTLTSSRGSFKSMSHRLDYRSKQYGLGGKHKMEMRDWIDIVEGRVSPLKKMVPYGLKDNDDTESIFWKELPYYNLPKTTINKILKLIIKPEEVQKKKQYVARRDIIQPCPSCTKKRQARFNTEMRRGKLHCNNCNGNF